MTEYKQKHHPNLAILGLRLSPDPSNSSGRILANCLRCSRFCRYTYSFCIYNYCFFCIFIISFYTIVIEPKIMPPNIAFLKATRMPALKASRPPVIAPAAIWLKASSFLRMAMSVQSVIEKSPAHRAKLPKSRGKYLRVWEHVF